MDYKIIDLKYPIPVKGQKGEDISCSQIKLGRIKAKHLKLIPKGNKKGDIDPEECIPLIAGLANLELEAIEELDFADLIKISEEMESFLQTSLENGKK